MNGRTIKTAGAMEEATGGGRVVLTLSLPSDLRKSLKAAAEGRKVSVNALVRTIAEEWLEREQGDGAIATGSTQGPAPARAYTVAAHALGLVLRPPNNRSYEATKDGRLYRLKVRSVERVEASTSFDFASLDEPFDYLVGILVSKEDPDTVLAVAKIPADLAKRYERPGNKDGDYRIAWNRWMRDAIDHDADSEIRYFTTKGETR
jgi:hypothetical protein